MDPDLEYDGLKSEYEPGIDINSAAVLASASFKRKERKKRSACPEALRRLSGTGKVDSRKRRLLRR
jgi:hypothetical protein